MPTDANGVHSLAPGYLAVTGTTVLASQHNPPLEDLSESVTLRVMRSGVTPMTGPLKADDGTVSAPGLTFASATSSGLYKTADGFGVAIGGALVAEFTAGGIRTGARYIGELIPFTGTTAPSLTVLPYGQTLSRTTYAALWAFAQVEIAAGNLFYNNGNGSTTFGIGDMRGRVAAGKDNIGGSTAGRLSATYFGAVTGATGLVIGGVGGLESHILTQAQHANFALSFTQPEFITNAENVVGTTPITYGGASGPINVVSSTNTGTVSIATSVAASSGGSNTPHNNVQPTMITNFILFAGA